MKSILPIIALLFSSVSIAGGTSSGGGIDIRQLNQDDSVANEQHAWFPISKNRPLTFCIEKDDGTFPRSHEEYARLFEEVVQLWQREMSLAQYSGKPQEQAKEETTLRIVSPATPTSSWQQWVMGFSLVRWVSHITGFQGFQEPKPPVPYIEKTEHEPKQNPFAQPIDFQGKCTEVSATKLDIALMLGKLSVEQARVLKTPHFYYAAAYTLPESFEAQQGGECSQQEKTPCEDLLANFPNSRGFVYLAPVSQSIAPANFNKNVWSQLIHTQGYNLSLMEVTLIHELGHVFGLRHDASTIGDSIMSKSYVYWRIHDALNRPEFDRTLSNGVPLYHAGILFGIRDIWVKHISNMGIFRFPPSRRFVIVNYEVLGLKYSPSGYHVLEIQEDQAGQHSARVSFIKNTYGFRPIHRILESITTTEHTNELETLARVSLQNSEHVELRSVEIVLSGALAGYSKENRIKFILKLRPNGDVDAHVVDEDGSLRRLSLVLDH